MQLTRDYLNTVVECSTQLYSANQVEAAVDVMAKNIEEQLGAKDLLCLVVMLGGMIPAAALLRRLHFPLKIDYVHATRYGGETKPVPTLQWLVKPRTSLVDRTILIVDDILDGGITLAGIVTYCKQQGAKEVFTAVLIDKQRQRDSQAVQAADFSALTVGDQFIYGYGMDYHEYLRNAPGIFAVAEQHI